MLIVDLPEQNAVKIGKLYFKPKNIEPQIARSVRLLVLEDKDNPNFLGRSGSCSMLQHGSTNLVACNRHQIGLAAGKIPDLRQLEALRFTSFNDPTSLTNIPVENCIFETTNEDQEYHDLLVFRVQETWDGLAREAPYFFPLKKFESKSKRVSSWFVGCPSSETNMEYEPQKIDIKTVISSCSFDSQFRSCNEHFRRFSYDNGDRSMDGFSGGSVFSMIGDIGSFEVVFDGIIVRAGQGFLYIIDADYLGRVAEAST